MIAPADKPRPTVSRGWLSLLVAGVAYAVLVMVVVCLRETTDFRDFWENAVHFRQTGEISADLGVHNYLPFFTIFMLPWGLLPMKVAIVIFSLLSLGLFALAVVMVENLLRDGFGHRPRAAMLIALGLMLPYVHSCAVLGNVGLIVLFLVVATWFLVERGREWPAGVALGLAVLIKLLPAVLLVFFLLKRRWRVAGGAVAALVVLGFVLPLTVLGWEETVRQHHDFYRRSVTGHSAYQTITAEKPRKALFSNNAVPIVLRRLLSHVDGRPGEETGPLYVNVADLPRRTILGIYAAVMLVVAGVSTVALLIGPRRWPPESSEEGRRLRAEFGLWCCLMLLASPLVWTHYLPLVYLPLALLAHRLPHSDRADKSARRLCIIALALWLICAVLLAWPAARASGAQIGGVAVLWLALAIISLRKPASIARGTGPD